jgi:8-oxo-dGTP pyrophosphatase MutT (NUDIX family)
MWQDCACPFELAQERVDLVYMLEEPPHGYTKSVFLVGPSTRGGAQSWRPDGIQTLLRAGYLDGIIIIPEMRDGSTPRTSQEKQAAMKWEELLDHADCAMAWVPRDLKVMPGIATSHELGRLEDTGRVVFAAPPEAIHNDYARYHLEKYGAPIASTLDEAAAAVVRMLGEGAFRFGAQRDVPLDIWRTTSFQDWYSAQKCADNVLSAAKPAWTLRIGREHQHMFCWALHATVYVVDERRRKSNEIVLSRPDIYTVLLYRRARRAKDTEVVLVREFHTRATTSDGFVHELPGGSTFTEESSLEKAAQEVDEETGLLLSPDRMREHGVRQVSPSISSHRGHLFSVELTEDELEWLRGQSGVVHGVVEETERTYVEITTLGEIRRNPNVDWSMLGMILQVLA